MNDAPCCCALRHLVLMAVCGWLMVPAQASPSQREPSERVRREADNPMRVIMEAATVKRGARPAEAVASPVPAKRPGPEPVKSSIRPTTITVITAPSKAAALLPNSPPEERPVAAPPAALLAETVASSPDGNADTTVPPRQPEPVAQPKQRERPTPAVRLIYKVDPVVPERLHSERDRSPRPGGNRPRRSGLPRGSPPRRTGGP
jgi:hypothetical protein